MRFTGHRRFASRWSVATRGIVLGGFFATLSLIALGFALRSGMHTVPLRTFSFSPAAWWVVLGGCFLALAVLTIRVFPSHLVDRTIAAKKMQPPTTAEYCGPRMMSEQLCSRAWALLYYCSGFS